MPDARSELNALLCLTTTSVTSGSSASRAAAFSSPKSVVAMWTESMAVGCLEGLLTESELRFLRRESILKFLFAMCVCKEDRYAKKRTWK
jgi:hypothetical protein